MLQPPESYIIALKKFCHICNCGHCAYWIFVNSYLKMLNLAVSFVGRSHWASDSVLQGNILKVGEALWRREIGLLPLSKVEFHSTVLHQHMWKKSTSSQFLSRDVITRAQTLAVLGECNLYFLAAFKVLWTSWKRDLVNSIWTLIRTHCVWRK